MMGSKLFLLTIPQATNTLQFTLQFKTMPKGKQKYRVIEEGDTCQSLNLPMKLQCIECTQSNSSSCQKLFNTFDQKKHLEAKYIEVWNYLKGNNYKLPRTYLNLTRHNINKTSSTNFCRSTRFVNKNRESARLEVIANVDPPPVFRARSAVPKASVSIPPVLFNQPPTLTRMEVIANVDPPPSFQPPTSKPTLSKPRPSSNQPPASKPPSSKPTPSFNQPPMSRFACSSDQSQTINITQKSSSSNHQPQIVLNIPQCPPPMPPNHSISYSKIKSLQKQVSDKDIIIKRQTIHIQNLAKDLSVCQEELLSLKNKYQNQSSNEESTTTYPTLNAHNISCNFDTHGKEIRKVLAELVKLFKNENELLTFSHSGNNIPGEAIVIPSCSNKRSYEVTQQREKWLEKMLEASVRRRNSCDANSSNSNEYTPDIDDAAEWLCSTLFKHFEPVYRVVARQHGLVGMLKLTTEHCVSLKNAANMNETNFQKFCRHFKVICGTYIQQPRDALLQYTGKVEDAMDVTFGIFEYWKNDVGEENVANHRTSVNRGEWKLVEGAKENQNSNVENIFLNSNSNSNSNKQNSVPEKKIKSEKIRYMMSCLTDWISLDLSRTIEISCSKQGGSSNNELANLLPTFGYPHVNVTIGCDHGAGSSRFVGKVNYLSSQERRRAGKVEHGSRIFTFGNVKCKKDKQSIMNMMAPYVNDTISKLQNGKIIGLLHKKSMKVEIFILPKESTNFKVKQSSKTKIDKDGKETSERLLFLTFQVPVNLSALEDETIEDSGEDTMYEEKRMEIKKLTLSQETPLSSSYYPLISNLYHIWTITPSFQITICGDLAFYATIQGRDGSSNCRCPYCDILISTNINQETKCHPTTSTPLSLSILRRHHQDYINYQTDLKNAKQQRKLEKETRGKVTTKIPTKPDCKGVKYSPQWNIEPDQFIVPLLHLEIGLVNKAIEMFKKWVDENIEIVSVEEKDARESYTKENSELENMKQMHENQEELVSTQKHALTEVQDGVSKLKSSIQDIIYNQKIVKTDISNLKRNAHPSPNSPLHDAKLRLNASKKLLHDKRNEKKAKEKIVQQCKEDLILLELERDEMAAEIKEKKKHLRTLKKTWYSMMEERIGKYEDGLESKLEHILAKYHILPQSFHGGSMNGVCCNRFLYNCNEILCEFKVIAMERLKDGNVSDEALQKRPTEDEVAKVFDSYLFLFELIDLVFSLLRTLAPDDKEVERAEKAIEMLEAFWTKELKIPLPPKGHVLYTHAANQFRDFCGIADKVEDFVEKAHQRGKQLEELSARVSSSNYKMQQLTMMNRMHQQDDPRVESINEKAIASTKRHFKVSRETKVEQAKRKRDERRKVVEQKIERQTFKDISNICENK